MADNLTTTTQIDPGVNTFYDRVLLKRALPLLVHDKFGQVRNIPAKSGTTVKFRRYSSLTAATTPLSEGVTPAGKQLSKTDLTATVSQYGDFVHVTDVVDLTVEDSTLTEAASLLGEQMGLTLDTLTRDILCACASIYSCASGTNSKTPTNITKTDIDVVVKTLLGANAKMIAEVLKATSGVGTTPVRPAFWAVAHTDLIDTIETCTGFLHHANYPAQNDVQEGEWGSVGNVRFLVSTNADRTTGCPGVYRIPVIGRDAYGISRIEQGTAKNIVKGYGSGGTSDPLDQRTTSGWKCWHVARILNDSFMLLMRASNSTAGA
jgi:N4-gp56 family major capsid protein